MKAKPTKQEDTSTASDLLSSEWRVKLDRLAVLLEQYQREKPWLDELERLKRESRAYVNERYPADRPQRLTGVAYHVDFGMREFESAVDKPKAFAALQKALGLKKLAGVLSYTLKLLHEHLGEDAAGGLITKARTGSREISAVRVA